MRKTVNSYQLSVISLIILLAGLCFGADYSISSPYTSDQLDGIQYAQMNDVMYLVHPDVQMQKLSRYANNNWTIDSVDFEHGPFLDQNDTTTTIAPSGTTGSVTLTASTGIFDAGHVNSIWKIDQKRGSSTFQGTIDGNENSAATYFFTGTFSFITEGTFTGTVTLERSENGSDWEAALTPITDRNYENPGENEDAGAYYRVTGSAWTSGSCQWRLTLSDNYNHGIVKITAYSSATSVTATVLTDLYNTSATTQWYEPAFSDTRGWPRAICFYQQRLCLAGTYHEPTKIWASKSFDYENFDVGTGLDNHAINYNITIAQQNPILWLHDLDTLIVGTSGGIFKWGALAAGDTLTPNNPSTRRLSGYGCDPIQPSFIAESLLFVERGGNKVNDLAYRLDADGYVVSDLTLLATHLTKSDAIVETAVMTRPTPILWCLRSDGVLLGLSYLKQQGIAAWHRHITDGAIQSICTIPGTDEDELWMVVQRTINSQTVRYVERMKPFNWGTDPDNCWFVDCGSKYGDDAAETESSTIAGLDWLEGETVQVFKGDSYETATVTGGQITLSESIGYPNSVCTIGLPYTSTLTTLPLEIQDAGGFTIGRQKILVSLFCAFEDSMSFEYVDAMDDWWTVKDAAKTVYTVPTTGYRPVLPVNGRSDWEISVSLRQQWPYPMTIIALYPTVDYSN